MLNHFTSSLLAAIADIKGAFERYHLIGTLGWQDVATRYRRSRIGAFWLTINMAVMIGSMGYVFGSLFKQPMQDFLPYLTVGLIFWGFLSNVINEGCAAFSSASGIVLQVRMPLFIHVARVVWRNLIISAHNLVIVPLVFLVFWKPVGWVALLAIPGFLLLLLNVMWIVLIASVVCTRFRDVAQIVQNAVQVLFFITPIMWTAETLQGRVGALILNLNPFHSFLDIVRSPILGQYPEPLHWVIAGGLVVAGWITALWFYGDRLRRLPYWL
jgi:ABC-type polysaccharide/polyol phosphate export permease